MYTDGAGGSINVSHQAVSKWERGDSLSDIECLVSLNPFFKRESLKRLVDEKEIGLSRMFH
jgi:DNA-binding XRE family transcriptional regulator